VVDLNFELARSKCRDLKWHGAYSSGQWWRKTLPDQFTELWGGV